MMKILTLKLLILKILKKEKNMFNIFLKNLQREKGLLEWDCDRLVKK